MSKYILMGLAGLLVACAPYVNAGNQNMVTIAVPNTYYEGEALALADTHCQKYGKTANLRKPRVGTNFVDLYDYTCVK
jgi:hypothetical protein